MKEHDIYTKFVKPELISWDFKDKREKMGLNRYVWDKADEALWEGIPVDMYRIADQIYNSVLQA